MENPEVANTSSKSDKKKKSKNKNSNESILHMEANVKPRRSFWRSLFKRQPKRVEEDSAATVITPRLNAIFEESKSSEEKDQIQEEIEEFKKALKQISPSVLESDPPPAVQTPQEEGLLEFLSDTPSVSETSATSSVKAGGGELNPSDAVKDKDAYSFEYSESSDTSAEAVEENKTQDKVKFVEKVEQKDADSNIVVKDLNPGEDEAAAAMATPELAVASDDPQQEQQEDNHSEDENKKTSNAEQPINKLLQHKRSPETIPKADMEQLNIELDPDRKSLDQKSTGSAESYNETEVWSERLNELSGLSKSVLPAAPDVNSLDETTSGYHEYRLDDFFKMVLHTNDDQILRYSVAYDPIFANFNFSYFPKNLGENETFPTDERQKVVRKRKMMSLLHDKNKMAEYLREIEQEQNEKLISDEKTMEYMINLNKCASVTAPQNSPKQKEYTMQIPPENQHEKILYILENTKEKLQKHLEKNNRNIDPKVLSLYPENYLNIFNIISTEQRKSFTVQSAPTISEIKDNHPTTKDSQTCVPTASSSQKMFQNVEKEIEILFKDLLQNVTELKDACILNGCPIDEKDLEEPFITMEPLVEATIVQPILEEILNNVFKTDNLVKGKFNDKPLSFVHEFGEIKNESGNIQITQPLHTFTVPKISLEQNLERNETILTALHDEIFQYNPVPYINSSESPPEPSENPESRPENVELLENLAENLIQNIEENLNDPDLREIDRSKKFGLYHEKKSENLVVDLPKSSRITNFNCNNPPDVTESLKHIFFGEEPNMSDFNLVEEDSPQAGPSTSKQEADLPKLPSVPSTPLDISAGSSEGHITTLLNNKFSEGTEFSTIGFPDEVTSNLEILNYNRASVSSEFQKKDLELARKSPETNLFQSEKPLNGDTISKSIQDNLKLFQENINKINNLNQKTIEMLDSATVSSPEGSLSILSTITENFLESIESTTSKTSFRYERYPQFIQNPKEPNENPTTSEKDLKKKDSPPKENTDDKK